MGRGTVSGAKLLTERDRRYLQAAESLGEKLTEVVPEGKRKDFRMDWAKVATTSRDAGIGLGGGALQRDAYCTRGRGGKVPLSNRNLRWHPLVAANRRALHFTSMKVEVSGKRLIFIDERGKKWTAENVHELPKPYCVDGIAWAAIVEDVSKWDADDWIANSCVIPAIEYCPAEDALETFALLGVTASFICGADAGYAYITATEFLNEFSREALPSAKFPKQSEVNELCICPVSVAPKVGSALSRNYES